jgi:hypothetical protein
MKMHRNSKMFLAAVLVGSVSGLASANAGSTPLGPPSPIGLAVLSTPAVTQAPVSSIDPFTLSTISSGQGAAVVVAVVADKSQKTDRSPGDKDHDHDGKGDNDNDGDGGNNGNGKG